MHQTYRRYLNKHGYTVEATAAHDRAPDLLQAIQPDIIVLDVRTPAGTEWALLERLRDSMEGDPIPIVVCTLEPDRERALALGAAAYLTKPFLEEHLVSAVRRVDSLPARRCILIIDEQPETAGAVATLLRTKGRYLVEVATDLEHGLDLIARRQPDLILLSLAGPGEGGPGNMPEALRRLRADPQTSRLPVLILTAGGEPAAGYGDQLTAVAAMPGQDSASEDSLLAGIQALLEDNKGSQHRNNGETAA